MRIYPMAEMVCEGALHAFKTRAAADAAAGKNGVQGVVFPSVFLAGENLKSAWLVCFGDRGCTSGILAAFADKASAEAAAISAEKADSDGYSFYACEVELE
jgi:hypothetical protein